MKRIDFSAFAYDASRADGSAKRQKVAPEPSVKAEPAAQPAAAHSPQTRVEGKVETQAEPKAEPPAKPNLDCKVKAEPETNPKIERETNHKLAPEAAAPEAAAPDSAAPDSAAPKEEEPVAADLTAASRACTPIWPGPLQPLLEPGLRYVFVGFNPGLESARLGHHYAHPSNRFWKLLHWSGLTPRKLACQEDRAMPRNYRIGFTDLVARSTKGIQQLSKQEMADGVAALDDRIGAVRPRVVCFVGKGIWEAVAKARGWDRKQFRYGLDTQHRFGHGGSLLCCVPSTSGLTSIRIEAQLAWWREVASLAPAPAGPA